MDADAHLDFVIAQHEVGFPGGGHGAGAQGHAHGTSAVIHPAGQRRYAGEVVTAGGGRAADLFGQHGGADAAAAGGVQAVLHRHVVIDNDRLHLDAASLAKLGSHFKIHDVAGVVLDDVEDAGSAIDSGSGRFHLVGTRGREDLAGTGGIEHALAHKSAVQGFVTAAAARNDAHLAGDRGVRPNHVHGIEGDLEDVGVGCGEPGQRFPHRIPRVVDQFLHHAPSPLHVFASRLGARVRVVPRCGAARIAMSGGPERDVDPGADDATDDRADDRHPRVAPSEPLPGIAGQCASRGPRSRAGLMRSRRSAERSPIVNTMTPTSSGANAVSSPSSEPGSSREHAQRR